MEEYKRLYTIVLVAALASVLLSTCLGALAGGLVGYWTGQNVSKRVTEERQDRLQERLPHLIKPEQPEQLLPLDPGGALVTDVVDGSPADRAGIRPGDLILAVGGVRIDQENALTRAIHSHKPGDRVEITLWSKGRERTIRVRLGEHPDKQDTAYLGVYHVLSTNIQRDSR